MKIDSKSHLDHGLSPEVIQFIMETFGDRDGFFIETVELPNGLTAPCGLYGPIMGDSPVPEDEVVYLERNGRGYKSRMVRRPIRMVNTITVIAGPDGDEPCVLYTAFGGPLAPREPGDPSLPEEEREESLRFWSEHALAIVE